MKQNCRNKIINLIKQIKNLPVNSKCIDVMLITDEDTGKLLASIVVDFFLLGVKNITKVNLKKKPQPHMAGIYYISAKSLSSIPQDFQKDPIYHSINILLSEPITEQVMKAVAAEKKITQRLAFFGELLLNTTFISNNIALVCKEINVFSSILKAQFNPNPAIMADKIIEALASGFQDNFRLKIYHSNSKYIEKLVAHICQKYQTLRKIKQQQQLINETQQVKTLNFLLVDRSLDIISPLVRNFYYLNMVSDLFKIDFQRKEVNLSISKTIKINFQDSIFRQYKNLHISKVPNLIEPDFKKFKTENKAAQLSQQGKANIGAMDMKMIIRDLPEFNNKVKSYEQQIEMLNQITKISKQQKLPEIGQIEQMIVSGLGGHGQQIKDKRILERALQLTSSIQDQNKIVKIMVLSLLCLQISESQKKSILNKIKSYPQYVSVAKILEERLIYLLPKPMKLKLNPLKEKQFLNMHQSLVQTIVSQILQKNVSKYVKLTVVGEQTKKQSKFEKLGKVQEKKWIIGMIGGISLNEIVHLQRLKLVHQNLDISFITTSIISSWEYLQRLTEIFE